jgi:ATP-dependent Clp protease adapter protein ClpS
MNDLPNGPGPGPGPCQGDPGVTTLERIDADSILGKPYQTILYNDENHSMDEVVSQIIKAIHCSPGKATEIMMQAHKNNRASVISGTKERCEHVASILEEIRLSTTIEPL